VTEAQWQSSTDPQKMLWFLHGKESDRKLRLFACGYCRQIWHLLTDEPSHKAVEAAEGYVDGQVTIEQLGAAMLAVFRAGLEASFAEGGSASWRTHTPHKAAYNAACSDALKAALDSVGHAQLATNSSMALAAQAALLRDIVGNPFRPIFLDSSWITWQDRLIRRLAEAAYHERHLPSGHLDPDRLAVLADALEEAGCDSQDLPRHLRGPGSHFRGCWALDCLLAKD
jgi:hypothetical protein